MIQKLFSLILNGLLALVLFTTALPAYASTSMEKGQDLMKTKPEGYPVAYFGGGCFWCVESEYRALDGVLFTWAGYMGGHVENPTYQQVTTGTTGHAEVVEITFDPAKISYESLLEFFLTRAHDPTQLNRQGVDIGPQYRSIIFYQDEAQKAAAEKAIAEIDASGRYKSKIVTQLDFADAFWPAEDYHQQYYEKYEQKTGEPHLRVLLKKSKKELNKL